MLSCKLYSCIAEGSDVLDVVKNEIRPDNLIIVRKDGVDGIARTESFSLERLKDSVNAANSDTRTIPVGLPSLIQHQVQQRAYAFRDVGGILVPFVTFRNKTTLEGEGFLVYGETKNYLASFMRAYRLPFPENFR